MRASNRAKSKDVVTDRSWDGEIGGSFAPTTLDELRGSLGDQPEDELRAADALAAEPDRRLFEVEARRVDVGSVAQAELHVHRCRRPDHLRHLVEAYEPTLVVRDLDVDVQRSGARLPDLAQILDGQVGGDVDRGRAALLEQPSGGTVRTGQQDRRLEDEVGRQVTRRSQASERRQHTEVAHEVRPNAVGKPPAYLGQAPLDPGGAARCDADG